MSGTNIKKNSGTAKKGQSKYEKGGTAGIEGILFQVNLLTVALLNAFQNFRGWRLSTENKRYGKFDDVVLEFPDSAILLQAKHRKHGKLLSSELFSVNSKQNDFSLGKYFFTYKEIKTKTQIKNLVICTNADIKVDAEMRKFLDRNTDSCESILYYHGDCSFYTFNDSILPKLEDHVRSYYSENLKDKDIDEGVITSENLSDFLKHLRFYCNYPCEDKLNKVIERLFSRIEYVRDLCSETSAKYLHNKMMNWFRQYQGVHLEDCHVKAIISEIRSNKYCEMLETYKVFFRDMNLVFKDTKRILHVVSKDGILLNVLNIYRALQGDNKTSTSILYVNPDDSVYLQYIVEAFELPQYTHLVIICPELKEETEITKINLKLREILDERKYKRVILVASNNNKFASEISLNNCIYDTSEEFVTFKNLSYDTQHRLVKTNIVFQGKKIKLQELFSSGELETSEDNADQEILTGVLAVAEKIIDPITLEKLVTSEMVTIGSLIEPLDPPIGHYYIDRKFKRKTDESLIDLHKEEILSEENIYHLKEKTILIVDGAGMGKSTVLTNLANTIKKSFPHLWVIKINLNDYTAVLKEFLKKNSKTLVITDLLESVHATKFRSQFERTVFSLDQRVLLMLDGVDEISPDYTELILSLLIQCQEAPNFAKVFTTARLHMTDELEEMLHAKSFQLQTFTDRNQHDFLTNYWMHDLSLGETERTKCAQYAEALINEMTSWKDFAEIPLHVTMLAEIFKTSNELPESSDWEGCSEFLNGNEEKPLLPQNLNIPKLYRMFIERKQDIFMTKGNPIGNAAANLALSKEFDECMAYHRKLALEEILHETESGFFPCYQEDDKKDTETNTLKIGIVQKIGNKFHFIHRTFAEYFVAESLLKELEKQKTNPNRKFQRFFIEGVLINFKYNIVRMFFDGLLQNVIETLPCDTFRKYQSLTYKNKLRSTSGLRLIHVLAEEGLVTILQFILKCIGFKVVKDKKCKIPKVAIRLWLKSPKFYFGSVLHFITYLVRRGGVNIRDKNEMIPLHCAVQNAHFEMVQFLVEQGADVNAEDDNGYTPLWIAVRLRHLETIEYLIGKGGDINKTNIYGDTMLHFTAYFRQMKILRLLMEHGPDLTIKNDRGDTVLQQTWRENLIAIVKLLVEHGADTIHVRRHYIQRSLHFAASFGQLNNVKLLVKYGGDVNKGLSGYFTPLHAAAERGHLSIVEFLVKKCDANVNVKNEELCTPLHLAALGGHLDIVKALVENQAAVDVSNVDGATALHLAISERHLEVVEFLIEHGADITNIRLRRRLQRLQQKFNIIEKGGRSSLR